ncbi:Manganese transport system ATP-binding protein (plasmid) [Roseomonas mucosa]|uniref:Energy-coupling factor transporter ATP-binding protein EcfA 1 n=1 Tax=Roseomonas mucosa TaxID=207340 RepID=A0A379PKX1_9PROT|nr:MULTISPECIES: metal ABC transporter ATP-binding protein [Roseomonas]MDT8291681.1 metal ABC transporter ATP-binding protein [Roseomonas mucosa]MDT8295682.1 metal ABC transporter ATP-binding protein [Roseomonas mucosa]MDT8352239.1 metal ABC transporter ATP-binding protein [Roseomonas mucosa]QDD92288.1 Manganese transport system ATP-binding protein [Roseomonas mucosa]QDD97595.1 Manganese transport system ATP-binding protein [Roseomonas mucosa]
MLMSPSRGVALPRQDRHGASSLRRIGRRLLSRAAPDPGPPQGKTLDLRVEGVTVAYANGHVALRDASLRLDGPTICGLLGVNGAGKSTLFKAIMGMVRPASGTVRIGGRTVSEAQKLSWMAYVPQNEEVDWAFPVSVRDVVMMGRYGYMNMLRIPSAADRAAVEEGLRRVGMEEFAGRQIGQLSGGQKKRVFLARALAQDGRIILLDEPFGGVDVTTQGQIMELLRELRAEGRIILVSTHDLASVPEFCDQVALVKGTVLAAGPCGNVFTPAQIARAFGDAAKPSSPGTAQADERLTLRDGGNGERFVVTTDGRVLGRLGPEV